MITILLVDNMFRNCPTAPWTVTNKLLCQSSAVATFYHFKLLTGACMTENILSLSLLSWSILQHLTYETFDLHQKNLLNLFLEPFYLLLIKMQYFFFPSDTSLEILSIYLVFFSWYQSPIPWWTSDFIRKMYAWESLCFTQIWVFLKVFN